MDQRDLVDEDANPRNEEHRMVAFSGSRSRSSALFPHEKNHPKAEALSFSFLLIIACILIAVVCLFWASRL